MWAFVASFVRLLVPPHDAEAGAVYRWRVAVALMIVGLAMGFSLHIALACGYLAGTIVGFPGFARADSVNDLKMQINQVQVTALDSSIWRDQEERCKAEAARNGIALNVLSHRIGEELSRYRQIAGHPYPLPPCDEMGSE